MFTTTDFSLGKPFQVYLPSMKSLSKAILFVPDALWITLSRGVRIQFSVHNPLGQDKSSRFELNPISHRIKRSSKLEPLVMPHLWIDYCLKVFMRVARPMKGYTIKYSLESVGFVAWLSLQQWNTIPWGSYQIKAAQRYFKSHLLGWTSLIQKP